MSAASKKESQEFKVPAKYKFQEGEKVLCFHGPLIYEAKCLQSRYDEKEKTPQYLIHYSGWNKSWDEWVPESRVLKHNESNLQKQKELYKAQKAEPKGKKAKKKSVGAGKEDTVKEKETEKRSVTPSEKEKKASLNATIVSSQESSSDVPKRKRPKLDPTVESEEQFLTKVEIKVKLPDELKPWLVDDWEMLSKNKKLVVLPAKVNIETILEDYKKTKCFTKNMTPEREGARLEVIEGIRAYFNAMLGSQLLYKIERKQHSELCKSHPSSSMTELYGAVHLLRLFVKLGPALAYTRLDEKCLQLLMIYLHDFLKFLYKNRMQYYDVTNDYVPVPIDYLR